MRSWFGRDQIEEVIAKLINEIDAASAVINLWTLAATSADALTVPRPSAQW
jgi:thymidylate synthase